MTTQPCKREGGRKKEKEGENEPAVGGQDQRRVFHLLGGEEAKKKEAWLWLNDLCRR